MVCVSLYVCVCALYPGVLDWEWATPAGLGLIHQQQQVLVSKRGNMRETRSNKQTNRRDERESERWGMFSTRKQQWHDGNISIHQLMVVKVLLPHLGHRHTNTLTHSHVKCAERVRGFSWQQGGAFQQSGSKPRPLTLYSTWKRSLVVSGFLLTKEGEQQVMLTL